jgi:hypothetical protein
MEDDAEDRRLLKGNLKEDRRKLGNTGLVADIPLSRTMLITCEYTGDETAQLPVDDAKDQKGDNWNGQILDRC